MCAVQLLRVSVHERITAAAEDFLLLLENRKETAEIPDLRTLLNQRLSVAAEEIFGLFEKTVTEYEDKVHQSEKEMCRQRKLLNIVLNPEVKLHRAVSPPDTQQLFVKKKESRQPHIKEEQEEFPFTPVPVKHEDQEKAESSQLHPSQTENRETEPLASCSTEQMDREADGEDCGGSPARSLDPAGALQPASDAQLFSSHSSESETEDSNDWKETREPQSGFKPLNELLVSDKRASIEEKPLSCSVCGKTFHKKRNMKIHMRVHTWERPFSCSVCSKSFNRQESLVTHMRTHNGEKPHSCSACGKRFGQLSNLKTHMRLHTGEKPFSCSFCDKRFRYISNMRRHERLHTGEKPYSCCVCRRGFPQLEQLRRHKCAGDSNSSR